MFFPGGRLACVACLGGAVTALPPGAEGLVVVGGVGGDGEALIVGAVDEPAIPLGLPDGDFEAGDAQGGEAGADVWGDRAEVFADEAELACLFEKGAR